MQKLWKYFIAVAGLSPAVLWADQNNGFSFLLLTPAVRASAMADAAVSIAEDGEAAYSNPAGLAFEMQSHAYAQSFIPPFLEGMKYNNFAYVRPTERGSWSFQSGVMNVGSFDRTVADNSVPDGFRETGDFSAYDYRLSVSMGRVFAPDWGFGATAGFIRESLADASANAFAMDFGILFKEDKYPVQIGAALQNLGTKPKFQDDSFNLPTSVKAGISFHQSDHFFPKFVPNGSLFAADYFKLLRGGDGVRGGFELPLSKGLRLRAGYSHSFSDQDLGSTLRLPNGLSFGLGLALKSFQLDYASSSFGELGLLHRISIDYKWSAARGVPRVLSDSYAR